MNQQGNAIEFEQVHYRLNGSRTLLSNLSIAVSNGETLMLLGRSGSGKTTMLKLINRLLMPTDGEVRVHGLSTAAWDPIKLRRGIGYAIQEVGLFPHYTLFQNTALVPKLEGWRRDEVSARVVEVLNLVGLPHDQFASRYPHQLSGGQRQRVGLARALAANPPILLMDEPFGALDPITRAQLQRDFKDLQQRLRKTVVFVTHDVSEALFLGHRISLLEDGKLCGTYTAGEFLASENGTVKSYVSTLKMQQDLGLCA